MDKTTACVKTAWILKLDKEGGGAFCASQSSLVIQSLYSGLIKLNIFIGLVTMHLRQATAKAGEYFSENQKVKLMILPATVLGYNWKQVTLTISLLKMRPTVHAEGTGAAAESVALGTVLAAVALPAIKELLVFRHVGRV